AMTITMMELKSLGIVAENGIDLHFLGRARGEKKIVELESAESQLELLSSFDGRQQQLFLEYTLRDVANLEKNFRDMFAAWRRGDAARLEELLKEPLRQSKEIVPIYRRLLDDRNVEMAEKIERYLKTDDTYFVVVGAGHLVGEKGLLRLLSRKYGVRPSIVQQPVASGSAAGAN
ncbi:MAG: TraB/GumN family protein, partial [Candidatus Binatia bacterium]